MGKDTKAQIEFFKKYYRDGLKMSVTRLVKRVMPGAGRGEPSKSHMGRGGDDWAKTRRETGPTGFDVGADKIVENALKRGFGYTGKERDMKRRHYREMKKVHYGGWQNKYKWVPADSKGGGWRGRGGGRGRGRGRGWSKPSKQCPYCSTQCTSDHQLALHIQNKHVAQKKNHTSGQITGDLCKFIHTTETGKRIWECPLCPVRCNGKDQYTAHMRRHENDKRRVKCPQCTWLFNRQDQLVKHLAKNHSDGNGSAAQYSQRPTTGPRPTTGTAKQWVATADASGKFNYAQQPATVLGSQFPEAAAKAAAQKSADGYAKNQHW